MTCDRKTAKEEIMTRETNRTVKKQFTAERKQAAGNQPRRIDIAASHQNVIYENKNNSKKDPAIAFKLIKEVHQYVQNDDSHGLCRVTFVITYALHCVPGAVFAYPTRFWIQ